MKTTVGVSAARPSVPNPNRTYALVIGGLAASLLGLGMLGVPSTFLAFSALGEQGQVAPSARLLACIEAAFASVIALVAAVALGTKALGNLSRLLALRVAGPLTCPDESVSSLLHKKEIVGFDPPSALVRAASAIFGEQILFSRGARRSAVEALFPQVAFFVVLVLFALAVALLPIGAGLPFAWEAVVLAAIAIPTRALAVARMPGTQGPAVNVVEFVETSKRSGDPHTFYRHVEAALGRLDEQYQNRVLFQQGPQLTNLDEGQWKPFEAYVVVETQPRSTSATSTPDALVLLLGGASALGLAFVVLLAMPWLVASSDPAPAGAVRFVLANMVVVLALLLGAGQLGTGRDLVNAFRFESDLVAVEVKGSARSSKKKKRAGKHGGFEPSGIVIQSETTVTVRAARIATESDSLDGPRDIFDTDDGKEFRRRLDQLRAQLVADVEARNLPMAEREDVAELLEQDSAFAFATEAAINEARSRSALQGPRVPELGAGAGRCATCSCDLDADAAFCKKCGTRVGG